MTVQTAKAYASLQSRGVTTWHLARSNQDAPRSGSIATWSGLLLNFKFFDQASILTMVLLRMYTSSRIGIVAQTPTLVLDLLESYVNT